VKQLEQEVENYRHHLEEIVAEQTQQLREALRQIERSYDHTLEVLGRPSIYGTVRRLDTHGAYFCTPSRLPKHGRPRKPDEKHCHGRVAARHRKLAIPDAILLKPGPLTDEERAIMQRHATDRV